MQIEQDNQGSSLVEPKVEISAEEFGVKFRSKGEIFRFLSSDVKCYLDSYASMTIYHLRDLASGEK